MKRPTYIETKTEGDRERTQRENNHTEGKAYRQTEEGSPDKERP